jgi:hypothetical protein
MMHIEHWGYQVADPVAQAHWYCEHMGFTIVRVNQDEAKAHFLADASRRVMIEIYRNPRLAVPDYQTIDPLQSHLAFACNTIEATIKALEAAGATLVNSYSTPMPGIGWPCSVIRGGCRFNFANGLCRWYRKFLHRMPRRKSSMPRNPMEDDRRVPLNYARSVRTIET